MAAKLSTRMHSIVSPEYITSYAGMFPFPEMPLAILEQYFEQGEDTGMHRHEDHYVLYVFSAGQGIHSINDHPYSVKRGDVYIASPGSVHAYREFKGLRADALCFQTNVFSPQQLEALRLLSGFWNLRVDNGSAGGPCNETVLRHRLHLLPEQHRVVESMLEELKREIESRISQVTIAQVAIARTLIPLLFFRLLVYLARIHDVHSQSAPPIAHEPGLAQVLRLCEERFAEPLSVPQLAATMFLSPGRFSQIFSAQMGTTPGNYLRRLRLERAQTLLRTSNDTAAGIAAQVGFQDAGQFSRAFRSAFGLTPLAYRSKFKK